MSKIQFKTPENDQEFKEYDLFRWKILREPIGKSVESLKDHHEKHAFHLIGMMNNKNAKEFIGMIEEHICSVGFH